MSKCDLCSGENYCKEIYPHPECYTLYVYRGEHKLCPKCGHPRYPSIFVKLARKFGLFGGERPIINTTPDLILCGKEIQKAWCDWCDEQSPYVGYQGFRKPMTERYR